MARLQPTVDRLALGDVTLASGATLPGAELVYATYGTLNASGDNCVLLPTYYTGTHASYARWIGEGRALDPARYFIVIPNMFGNGVSTSPSHGLGADFPTVSILDNVACQHRLLTETLGVKRIAMVAGWSMGALQSVAWAAAYPDMVETLFSLCGASRCWPLNRVFLEGVAAALKADGDWADGRYETPPIRGLRAFGRAYCGWAYSAEFFREGLYANLGPKTLDAFLRAWEREHEDWDANDLLAMLNTWVTAEIGDLPGCDGDYRVALGRIQARTVLSPCDTDSYFTVAENAIERALIPGAELRPIVSPYGHCAGAPGRFAKETAFVERRFAALLGDA